MTQNTRDADVAFIQALAEVLTANDLTELQVKRDYAEGDSLNVRVSKHAPMPQVMAAPAAPAYAATGHGTSDAVATPAAAQDDPAQHPGAVTSPMVGTVYLQPEPGAGSFVTVGDTVTEGQTLLIIEAMKTMNQIPAPRSGTVRRIMVEDGSPVEFGAPLMIVD